MNLGEERKRLQVIAREKSSELAGRALGIKPAAVRDWLNVGDRLERCAKLAQKSQTNAQKAVFRELQTADVARLRKLEAATSLPWVLRYYQRRRGHGVAT